MDNDNDSRIKDIIYRRRNGYDIVNDPEAIASCKREQSRDVIDNSRLGSYDKYGNYIIIPEIKRELIGMPKLVYNQYSSGGSKIFELKSTLPIFNDVFMKLVITGDMANLLICEQVNREAGGYLEAYDEVIDSLAIGTEERMPQSLIFRTYNVFDDPNDFGKELKDSKFDNILTRKVYLSLLAKELRNVSTLDEKDAFKNMVSTLKQGGTYGNKVLNEFLGRLKDRPAVFEISKAENYNKAMNEILLSSLEIATTEQDKQDSESRQVYLSVLSARDRNIDYELRLANDKVSEEYVKHIVDKAKQDFVFGVSEELSATDEFYSKLNEGSRTRHRTLDKPILKQGKESSQEPQTKEEKIKQILAGKNAKKTPKNVKLKASKGKKPVKKLKASKKKTNAKKKVKAKVKVKKKVKKAKPKKKAKAKRKKPKKAKLKAKKKVKKAKKKLGKKKTAKKKVKRKLAKRKLKGKKGKLKSKKKVKKAKKAKKATKLAAKKPSKSGAKFASAPKKAKKKAGMSMGLKQNVLDSQNSLPESSGNVEFFTTGNIYKFKKIKKNNPIQQQQTFVEPQFKIEIEMSSTPVRSKLVDDKKQETAVSGKNSMIVGGLVSSLNSLDKNSSLNVESSSQQSQTAGAGVAAQHSSAGQMHSDLDQHQTAQNVPSGQGSLFDKLKQASLRQEREPDKVASHSQETILHSHPQEQSGETMTDILSNINKQNATMNDEQSAVIQTAETQESGVDPLIDDSKFHQAEAEHNIEPAVEEVDLNLDLDQQPPLNEEPELIEPQLNEEVPLPHMPNDVAKEDINNINLNPGFIPPDQTLT